MDISDILDQQTMEAILADAKASGISAEDVKAVLGNLTDKNKAPTRTANSEGELMSLLGDDKDAVAADIADATGVDRSKTSTILMLAAPFLLKYLFSSSSSGSSAASSGNLLGALLGGGVQQQPQSNGMGALLNLLGGVQQPQQNNQAAMLASLLGGQTQQPGQASLLSSLLGGQTQQTPTYTNNSTAALLGSLMGGSQQPQNNGLGGLMDLMGGSQQPQQQTSQSSGGGLMSALFNLLGDNGK